MIFLYTMGMKHTVITNLTTETYLEYHQPYSSKDFHLLFEGKILVGRKWDSEAKTNMSGLI